jgi:hypothetical protein
MTTGFVHIIESPDPDDLLDGRMEGRVLGEALTLADIPHSYTLAANIGAFRRALSDRLVTAWTKHAVPPIIHLSMHGNADGIQLLSGEFVTWNDLRRELMPLFRAMPNALLVCMSSCFGIAGCRTAMNLDNEPHFWALVGHPGTVAWADSAVAYVTFYHLFFKGTDVATCVEAMKTASGDAGFAFTLGADIKRDWSTQVQKLIEAEGTATVSRFLSALLDAGVARE